MTVLELKKKLDHLPNDMEVEVHSAYPHKSMPLERMGLYTKISISEELHSIILLLDDGGYIEELRRSTQFKEI